MVVVEAVGLDVSFPIEVGWFLMGVYYRVCSFLLRI
jgi:hypothetical protein